jgi:hypothetical protein
MQHVCLFAEIAQRPGRKDFTYPKRMACAPLLTRLGIRVPMFLAPMAGVCTPDLVLACGRAGALGGFGFAYTVSALCARLCQW